MLSNSPVGKTSQVVMIQSTLQVRKQFQRGYVLHPESDLDSQDVSAGKYIRDERNSTVILLIGKLRP